MTAKELAEVLQDLPEDFPVKVIMDGEIDDFPSFNVDDDCIYLEGISPSAAAKKRRRRANDHEFFQKLLTIMVDLPRGICYNRNIFKRKKGKENDKRRT